MSTATFSDKDRFNKLDSIESYNNDNKFRKILKETIN